MWHVLLVEVSPASFLQGEVQGLKAQLQEKQHVDPSMLGRPVSIDDSSLAMIDSLAQEMNDNIEERINLQKALFELEDLNVCNMYEKKNLEDVLDQGTDGKMVGEGRGELFASQKPFMDDTSGRTRNSTSALHRLMWDL